MSMPAWRMLLRLRKGCFDGKNLLWISCLCFTTSQLPLVHQKNKLILGNMLGTVPHCVSYYALQFCFVKSCLYSKATVPENETITDNISLVFVVFCMLIYTFVSSVGWTPLPTFSTLQ